MKNELHIVEEFQSSQWGQICVREALGIAKDLLAGKYVYVFKKKTTTDAFDGGGRPVFHEGWAVTTKRPGYYNTIGSCDEPRKANEYMLTMYSREGQKKQSYQPNTRFWSLWFTFDLMFREAGIRVKHGRIQAPNEGLLQTTIEKWEDILSKADGRPMMRVIGEYTMEEIKTLSSMAKTDILSQLDDAYNFLQCEKGARFPKDETNLLLKGFTGYVAAAKARLQSRCKFWQMYVNGEEDIYTLAKRFSGTTEQWSRHA